MKKTENENKSLNFAAGKAEAPADSNPGPACYVCTKCCIKISKSDLTWPDTIMPYIRCPICNAEIPAPTSNIGDSKEVPDAIRRN